MMGGLRDLARGDTSLEGEASRELVLEPPGDNIGLATNSSVGRRRKMAQVKQPKLCGYNWCIKVK